MAAVARARASVQQGDAAAQPDGRGYGRAGGRLSPVHDGFARAEVADIQRKRILAAMYEVACERGGASVTVAHVVERSGVSRRTFYELFADREDCFLAALDEAVARVGERVLPAYRAAAPWRTRLRSALGAFLAFLDEEPSVGRLLVVESLGGGARALERRRRVLAHVTSAVDEGREEVAGSKPLELTAEGLVGGAAAVIHARLLEGRPTSLVQLLNPLMSMIVLPYLGVAAARREHEHPMPVPAAGSHDSALLSDPFKAAGMRLTYRTVRVLLAVDENPDASNRLVGDAAGIKDQGQISKLLGRLERAGLISNSGLGPGQGAPNSWTLTERGRHVADGLALRSVGTQRKEGT